MDEPRVEPISKEAIRRAANDESRERFGAPANRLPTAVLTGSTGDSADARRLASIVRYAKK